MAIAAIAISIATFGAGVPLIIGIIAGVTLGAGILTGINGIATMVEAGTEYNFVRDGLFNEVLGLGDEAYDIYAGVTAVTAQIGTAVLGVYQMTGQFKAARQGRNFLGKGYKKVGDRRWVSKDGMRQLRWDNAEKGGHINHFNLETWKVPIKPKVKNSVISNLHYFYKGFKYWVS